MEDDNMFTDDEDDDAPGWIQIGVKIEPGIPGDIAMCLLYVIQQSMEFIHVHSNPSISIFPIL